MIDAILIFSYRLTGVYIIILDFYRNEHNHTLIVQPVNQSCKQVSIDLHISNTPTCAQCLNIIHVVDTLHHDLKECMCTTCVWHYCVTSWCYCTVSHDQCVLLCCFTLHWNMCVTHTVLQLLFLTLCVCCDVMTHIVLCVHTHLIPGD